MNLNKRSICLLFATNMFFGVFPHCSAEERKGNDMTVLSARLQPLFQETKTVCFGRFMVDVPASAIAAWGRSIVPLATFVAPNGVDDVYAEAAQFISKLKNENTIDKHPFLISVITIAKPEGKIVVGHTSYSDSVNLAINGYFKLPTAGVIVKALPMKERKDDVIEKIKKIASRVRQRDESEVPSEPGNCIESGFLPDESGLPPENPGELLEIGFRLKEFPDTHLSIAIRPAQRKFNESNTLEWQLSRLEKDLKAEDSDHIRLKTKYFRRGKRTIQNWGEGFEALARSPEQTEIHSIHDFGMDFQGIGNDPLKPFIHVQMQTGISDNEAGAVKPLLTDAEAIAVWDKITNTIRVRPTGVTAVKSASTDPMPPYPLGELAPTGRKCPQTGMWESSEAPAINGVQRRYLKAGDTMPRVAVRGAPSLWQRMKGETPSHQLATIWKLVGYGDASTPANTTAEKPFIAQAIPEASDGYKSAIEAADDGRNAEAPSNGKG